MVSDHTIKKILFINMTILSIVINLDGGAVPAGLLHIEQTFALSTSELGLIFPEICLERHKLPGEGIRIRIRRRGNAP